MSATDHELRILAAWWWSKGSNEKAAFVLGLKRQTVKNALCVLRRAEGAESNVELVMKYMGEIQARKTGGSANAA